jgi:hypothetical protein
MDRIHFIEHAVERLDDEAFAAFLTWFDHYADTRWAGRCRDPGVPAMGYAGAHSVANSVANSVAMSPSMICEPQLAAWSARAALEE